MRKPRKLALVALMGSSMLLTTSCADDNLAKGMLTIGGTLGGAYLGRHIAGPGNRTAGMLMGGVAGGLLGFLLGGSMGGGGKR